MAKEVALLILLGPAVVEAVPAGVEDDDVALLYLHAVGHLLRLDHGPVVHLIGEVDDHAFSAERGQRDRGHVLAARDDVHLAIEMRPGVKRRLQILRDDAVGGVALEVAELRRRVADPPGCVDREDVRQIDQLHPLPPPSE
ncbi:MAG: hypothetical protein AUI15_19085 [Actinobacteria bacterium 13_2_20CM_2_66_6]|nr:MAG: hypothetical protein AUI15_19085 [Actinobacteria bacterium 13_2_20CM_2_66_6]